MASALEGGDGDDMEWTESEHLGVKMPELNGEVQWKRQVWRKTSRLLSYVRCIIETFPKMEHTGWLTNRL